MADNHNSVNSLISGIEFKDTKLATLLQTLANDLYGLNRQINPPVIESFVLNPGGATGVVTTPTNFIITVFTNNIRLSWNPIGTETFLYEIKLGPVYEVADVLLTTATLSADIDPISRFIESNATYTFWITALNSFGDRSVPASATTFISPIAAPILTNTVVGNNVLLKWTVPASTFTIDHFVIGRNGAVVGILAGTFDVIFETAAGTYYYAIQAIDIVGNVSALSGIVSVTLGPPTDFILHASVTSTFSGLKVNVAIDYDGRLLCNADPIISWEDHFINNGWATIEEQIDAGYPLYFEPGP